ncbi:MAG: dihydrolipoamide acyltransferase [Burkholderiales bacterium]|nr:dihydrolipoamide acyltransferase [Burkholderiales bacterium]MDR4518307.1 dihydrolipoamide acyltransferase [Nitrosomonas sp.]
MKQIKGILFLFTVLTVLSITGCGSLEKNLLVSINEDRILEDANDDQLNNLMHEYIHFEQENNTVLEQYYLSVKENFELDNNYHNRFKYILLLTLPNQKFNDHASALDLLKNWPHEEQMPASMQSFRKFLIIRLEEEARLKNHARHLTHQLANERMNAETLQKKIDDIKNMEKSLIRRNLQ